MLDVPNVDNSSQNTLSLLRWWILPSLLLVTLCLGVIWRKSQPKEWEGFSVYHFHVRFQLDSVKKQIQSRCLLKSIIFRWKSCQLTFFNWLTESSQIETPTQVILIVWHLAPGSCRAMQDFSTESFQIAFIAELGSDSVSPLLPSRS